METEWRRQRCDLVAKIDCSSGKRKLKGGGVGWFQVDSIEWRSNWKLRVEVSVMELRPDHPYKDPQVVTVDEKTAAAFLDLIPEHLRPKRVQTRPNAQYYSGPVFVQFVVERDIVEVVFPIPNCVHRFHRGGWGCAGGKRIDLSSGRHHCQARLVAKRPNYKSDLRRTKEGIEFVETDLAQVRVFDRVKDC